MDDYIYSENFTPGKQEGIFVAPQVRVQMKQDNY